jgi:hypothetical protein
VYLDGGSTAGDLHVGLYTNNLGPPGNLLASGTVSGQAAGGWVTVALSGAVPFPGTWTTDNYTGSECPPSMYLNSR